MVHFSYSSNAVNQERLVFLTGHSKTTLAYTCRLFGLPAFPRRSGKSLCQTNRRKSTELSACLDLIIVLELLTGTLHEIVC